MHFNFRSNKISSISYTICEYSSVVDYRRFLAKQSVMTLGSVHVEREYRFLGSYSELKKRTTWEIPPDVARNAPRVYVPLSSVVTVTGSDAGPSPWSLNALTSA